MSEHPIQGLMMTAMNSIKEMIDVNTIIGEAIETNNNIIIIPISKVGFGFAAGGSEFKGETINEYSKKDKDEQIQYKLPFGGGSGAGVSITPIAFLIVQNNNVKLLPVSHTSSIDRLLDYVPDLVEKTNALLNKQLNNMKEDKKENQKLEQMKIKKQNEEKQRIEKQEERIDRMERKLENSRMRAKPVKQKAEIPYEYEYEENYPQDIVETTIIEQEENLPQDYDYYDQNYDD